MKNATIVRQPSDEKQTLGTIQIKDSDWKRCTLELPWLNNEANKSCIPTGTYRCSYTRSNRLSGLVGHDVFTYELQHVPDRAGIRIHSANESFQLLGCIALGSAEMDINKDGEEDVINSRVTVADFESQFNKEDFLLTIS